MAAAPLAMGLFQPCAPAGGAHPPGRVAGQAEARAVSAYYVAKADRIVVDLTSGATIAFPPGLAEGLAGAGPDELGDIEISGRGRGLHWVKLDVDLSLPSLVARLMGPARWMAASARRATTHA